MLTKGKVLTECMMLVVFINPPGRQKPRTESGKIAQSHAKGIDTVTIIMSQPSGCCKGQTECHDTNGRDRMSRRCRTQHQRGPQTNQFDFVGNVPLPPSLLFQFRSKLSKGKLKFCIGRCDSIQHGGRFFLALGQPFVHSLRLLAVKGIHNLGSIATIVPINPVSSRWMCLSPSCQIVPLSVDSYIKTGTTFLFVAGCHFNTASIIVTFPGGREFITFVKVANAVAVFIGDNSIPSRRCRWRWIHLRNSHFSASSKSPDC